MIAPFLKKYSESLIFLGLLIIACSIFFSADIHLRSDTKNQYIVAANNLIQGKGFTLFDDNKFLMRQGYIFILAISQLLFGKSILAILLIKIFFGSLFPVTMYFFAKRFWNVPTAVLSYLLIIGWLPFHSKIMITLDPIWPSIIMFSMIVLALSKKSRKGELLTGAGAGLMILYAIITKEWAVLFIPTVPLMQIFCKQKISKNRLYAFLIISVFGSIIYFIFFFKAPYMLNKPELYLTHQSLKSTFIPQSITDSPRVFLVFIQYLISYFLPTNYKVNYFFSPFMFSLPALIFLLWKAWRGKSAALNMLIVICCFSPFFVLINFLDYRPSQGLLAVAFITIGLTACSIELVQKSFEMIFKKPPPGQLNSQLFWVGTSSIFVLLPALLFATAQIKTSEWNIKDRFQAYSSIQNHFAKFSFQREFLTVAALQKVIGPKDSILTPLDQLGIINFLFDNKRKIFGIITDNLGVEGVYGGEYPASYKTKIYFRGEKGRKIFKKAIPFSISLNSLNQQIVDSSADFLILNIKDKKGSDGIIPWLQRWSHAIPVACLTNKKRALSFVYKIHGPLPLDGMQDILLPEMLDNMGIIKKMDSELFDRAASRMGPFVNKLLENSSANIDKKVLIFNRKNYNLMIKNEMARFSSCTDISKFNLSKSSK